MRARHSYAHSFFAIDRPDEVLVHTIFTGEGEREPELGQSVRSPRRGAVEPAVGSTDPVIHNAICNLCDSRIRGDRYVSVIQPAWSNSLAHFVLEMRELSRF